MIRTLHFEELSQAVQKIITTPVSLKNPKTEALRYWASFEQTEIHIEKKSQPQKISKAISKPKRGPTKKNFDSYIQDAKASIVELKEKLNNETEILTSVQKRSLRNRISAYQARINQRMDTKYLKEEIERKDDKLSLFLTEVKMFMEPARQQ